MIEPGKGDYSERFTEIIKRAGSIRAEKSIRLTSSLSRLVLVRDISTGLRFSSPGTLVPQTGGGHFAGSIGDTLRSVLKLDGRETGTKYRMSLIDLWDHSFLSKREDEDDTKIPPVRMSEHLLSR